MNRYLSKQILTDVTEKMVFITGPRQVGKTTLAKSLAQNFLRPLYLNYDSALDRARINGADWADSHDYVMLDEIHAMPDWKKYLKGVFDTKPAKQSLLITGSARLDTFRQTGESLAGRYFRWRLHPFSVKEFAPQVANAGEALDALLRFGGFPEPLLKATDSARKRWQKISGSFRTLKGAEDFCTIRSYLDSLIKQGHNLFEALRTAFIASPISLCPD